MTRHIISGKKKKKRIKTQNRNFILMEFDVQSTLDAQNNLEK